MLVAEDVYQIRSDYHGIYTAVYLITGEYLTLIDSGETETWREKIVPYISSTGREPSELKRIIHTHGHDDHIHGDLQIREQTGAEISARICAEFGPNRPQPRGHGTVRLHLVQLAKEGKIVGRVSEDGVGWSRKGEAGR